MSPTYSINQSSWQLISLYIFDLSFSDFSFENIFEILHYNISSSFNEKGYVKKSFDKIKRKKQNIIYKLDNYTNL